MPPLCPPSHNHICLPLPSLSSTIHAIDSYATRVWVRGIKNMKRSECGIIFPSSLDNPGKENTPPSLRHQSSRIGPIINMKIRSLDPCTPKSSLHFQDHLWSEVSKVDLWIIYEAKLFIKTQRSQPFDWTFHKRSFSLMWVSSK